MKLDISKERLPAIYQRAGKPCYLDPVREKLVYITPEETVRQKIISYLTDTLHVPVKALRVEEQLSHYGLKSRGRADIIIEKYDKENDMIMPLAVIECKEPDVILGDTVMEQMMRYADDLCCPFCMMTNGMEAFCYYYDAVKGRYVQVERLPTYAAMIREEYTELPDEERLPRLTLEEIREHPRAYAEIGAETPDNLAIGCINLWECLLYPERKLPRGTYKLFELLEDYGVRILTYGNASGGRFQGAYRSFLIQYKNSTEFVSIGLYPYVYARPDCERTVLCVAIDNEKSAHHALQLSIDENVVKSGNKYTFYHHGRIAVGRKGSGRVEKLRQFVEKEYPSIVDGKQFKLGTLANDRLWTLDDPEVKDFIENLISYALIRDRYRAYVKDLP